MKKVTVEAYKTSDGQLFEKEEDAEIHENKLQNEVLTDKLKKLCDDIYHYNIGSDGIASRIIENIDDFCDVLTKLRKTF